MWKRVIAPIAFVSLLWIVFSSGTSYYLDWLLQTHNRIHREYLSTIRAVAQLQEQLWNLHSTVMDTTPGKIVDLRARIRKQESALERQLDEVEATSFTAEEQILVASTRKAFQRYRDFVDHHLETLVALDTYLPPSVETVLPLARAVADRSNELMDLNDRLVATATQRSSEVGGYVMLARTVVLIVGPLLGVLFGLWVAWGIHRSIARISITLEDATGASDRQLGRLEIRPSSDLPQLQQQVELVVAKLREMMDELQRARREAMRAERLAAVGELAAGVAHELRNPLTSVKLLIQTAVQRGSGKALGDRQLNVIQEEVLRMENTIQGLLDFARPPQLHRLRHDLRETLLRAIRLIDGRAKQESVSIQTDVPEAPVFVDGDREQLHQVFVNLLLNGIEAMERGGVFHVQIAATAQAVPCCLVVFADSGRGISDAVLGRIFEPFVTDRERGTGLGLAVSHRIIQEHGGTITARNDASGGAVFTVELPLAGPEHPTGGGRLKAAVVSL
jgi:signal transduction histidine kinase